MDHSFNAAYYNAVDQIYHAQWTAVKLARLELVKRSVKKLWPQGHPTRLIQITGTSGKGSTSRFLEAGLSLYGQSGALMSPHIFDYKERFSINGQTVSQDDVIDAWESVIRPLCIEQALHNKEQAGSFQEVNILLALVLFEKYEVETAVVEVGVGGRYDQTTALDFVATGLTNIGRDHEDLLGKEKWQRAIDKAGIAKQGVPFFTSERDPATLQIIASICEHVGAPLHPIGQRQVDQLETFLDSARAHIPPGALLSSGYQAWNAALSLEIIKHLIPTAQEHQILYKFLTVKLLGRFLEVEPGVYADIAHNPEKIAVLAKDIEERFEQEDKIFVIGLSGQRSAAAMFASIMKIAKTVIVTSASFRGQNPDKVGRELADLDESMPIYIIPEARQALHVAKSIRQQNDVIVLTGSSFMLDQALNPDPYLRYINDTFGWRGSV